MKTLSSIFTSAAIIVAFASCGSKNEPVEKLIPASNVEISGPDANYLSISGDVKLFMVQNSSSDQLWSIRALVPLKANQAAEITDIFSSEFNLLDANFSKIHDKFGMHIQNKESAISLISSGAGNQKNIVFEPIWENISYFGYDDAVEILNKTENIGFILKLQNSEQSSISSLNDNNGNNNFDLLLNDYEELVDSYVRLYKKAKAGDESALDEYETYLEKAEDISDKLSDADDVLTSAQLSRYMQITQKMTKVLDE